MPAAEANPFVILQIEPNASLDEVDQAFRGLAHLYHPDKGGVADKQLMQQLLWARDELRRDLAGWRVRTEQARVSTALVTVITRTSNQHRSTEVATRLTRWLEISPRVILLGGVAGDTKIFVARAQGGSAADIRVFVRANGPIRVSRTHTRGDEVGLRVEVTNAVHTEQDDAYVTGIVLEAPGFLPTQAIVSITPLTASVMSQRYRTDRIAPARIVSVDARISFGKHKGRTFAQIALEEPNYLRWMLREGAGSEIERECAAAALGLERSAPPRRPALPPVNATRRRRGVLTQSPRREEIPNHPPAKPLPSLPTPPARRGLLATLRSLVRGQ